MIGVVGQRCCNRITSDFEGFYGIKRVFSVEKFKDYRISVMYDF